MNTFTSSTQAWANYLKAADDIMDLMDELGFTSDKKVDPIETRNRIANTIRESVEGNTFYAVVENPAVGEVPEYIPEGDELDKLFEQLDRDGFWNKSALDKGEEIE